MLPLTSTSHLLASLPHLVAYTLPSTFASHLLVSLPPTCSSPCLLWSPPKLRHLPPHPVLALVCHLRSPPKLACLLTSSAARTLPSTIASLSLAFSPHSVLPLAPFLSSPPKLACLLTLSAARTLPSTIASLSLASSPPLLTSKAQMPPRLIWSSCLHASSGCLQSSLASSPHRSHAPCHPLLPPSRSPPKLRHLLASFGPLACTLPPVASKARSPPHLVGRTLPSTIASLLLTSSPPLLASKAQTPPHLIRSSRLHASSGRPPSSLASSPLRPHAPCHPLLPLPLARLLASFARLQRSDASLPHPVLPLARLLWSPPKLARLLTSSAAHYRALHEMR